MEQYQSNLTKKIPKTEEQIRREKILGLDGDKKTTSPLGRSWINILHLFIPEFSSHCQTSDPCSLDDQQHKNHVHLHHQVYSCETCMKKKLGAGPGAYTRYAMGPGRTCTYYHCNPINLRNKKQMAAFNTMAMGHFLDD
jgi:hypothetical protein